MGVLPLQFLVGESAGTFELDGTKTFSIGGIADGLAPEDRVAVTATCADGSTIEFEKPSSGSTPRRRSSNT